MDGQKEILLMVILGAATLLYLVRNWRMWVLSTPGVRWKKFGRALENTVMITATWLVILTVLHAPFTSGVLKDGPELVWRWFLTALLAGAFLAAVVIVLGARLGVFLQNNLPRHQI